MVSRAKEKEGMDLQEQSQLPAGSGFGAGQG